MFAMLLGNVDLNPMVQAEFQVAPVTGISVLGVLFMAMLVVGVMALGVAAVVGILMFCLRGGKKGNELKEIITNQQTQIDDLKRELEEIKQKLKE